MPRIEDVCLTSASAICNNQRNRTKSSFTIIVENVEAEEEDTCLFKGSPHNSAQFDQSVAGPASRANEFIQKIDVSDCDSANSEMISNLRQNFESQ